jgi:hypothetical protein
MWANATWCGDMQVVGVFWGIYPVTVRWFPYNRLDAMRPERNPVGYGV